MDQLEVCFEEVSYKMLCQNDCEHIL